MTRLPSPLAIPFLLILLTGAFASASEDDRIKFILQTVSDKESKLDERLAGLRELRALRRALNSADRQVIQAEVRRLAFAPDQPTEITTESLQLYCAMKSDLLEEGIADLNESDAKEFLSIAAGFRGSSPRATAIRCLERLQLREAIPDLRSMLSDNLENQPLLVSRSLVLTLARLSAPEVEKEIVDILETTRQRELFDTAALALGEIQAAEALQALVNAKDRFPDSPLVANAVNQRAPEILLLLKDPMSPYLKTGIEAIRLIWLPDAKSVAISGVVHLLGRDLRPEDRHAAGRLLLDEALRMDFSSAQRLLAYVCPTLSSHTATADLHSECLRALSAVPLEQRVAEDQPSPPPPSTE